jgi:hypothetical protein
MCQRMRLACRWKVSGRSVFGKRNSATPVAHTSFYPDLAFDWHITWNTATPGKLALGDAALHFTQGQEVSQNLTEYQAAASHDNAEILSEEFFRESASRADYSSLAQTPCLAISLIRARTRSPALSSATSARC